MNISTKFKNYSYKKIEKSVNLIFQDLIFILSTLVFSTHGKKELKNCLKLYMLH